MIKELLIAEKLQHIQQKTKDFYGESYPERVKTYRLLIETVMKAHQCDPIPAFIIVSETDLYLNKTENQMLFISALCDVINDNK